MKKIFNLVVALALLITTNLYSAVTVVTDKGSFDTQVIKSSKPSVVKFYSDTCPPCKKMKPIFEALSNELSDKYNFVEVNSGKTTGLCSTYSVTSIPTFVFFKNGKEVSRFSGSTPRSDLLSKIESNLK